MELSSQLGGLQLGASVTVSAETSHLKTAWCSYLTCTLEGQGRYQYNKKQLPDEQRGASFGSIYVMEIIYWRT